MNTQILRDYVDRIRNAPEQKILEEIASLRWSFRILHGNYKELVDFLELLEDNPQTMALWDVKRRNDLLAAFRRVGRLLFNYLASAFMLIDHTRRHLDCMYSAAEYSAFKTDCEQEIERHFTNNDTHLIAQGLRNYIQHRKLPSVGSTIHYTATTGLDRAFMVSIPSLLEWDGWSTKAREVLTAKGTTLPLRHFIQEHFNQLESLHKWLWTNQVRLHKKDFDRLNQLKREARTAFKDAGLLTPDQLEPYNISI